jgi:cell division protein FtsB
MNNPAAFLKNLWHYRLLVILAAFLVWLTFLDRHNLISQVRITYQLKKLKAQAETYKTETARIQTELNDILRNPEKTESFARETYLMKKEGEKIFMIAKPE